MSGGMYLSCNLESRVLNDVLWGLTCLAGVFLWEVCLITSLLIIWCSGTPGSYITHRWNHVVTKTAFVCRGTVVILYRPIDLCTWRYACHPVVTKTASVHRGTVVILYHSRQYMYMEVWMSTKTASAHGDIPAIMQ